MYPHERSLVKRLADKPFALIGVNSDRDKDELKKVLEKENITWRSFWNGGSTTGPISTQWNVQGWPTIYVLDAKGVIRHKGHTLTDKMVDDLLAEMEAGEEGTVEVIEVIEEIEEEPILQDQEVVRHEEELEDILDEFEAARAEFMKAYRAAESDEERAELAGSGYPEASDWAPRVRAVAVRVAGTDEALEPLQWLTTEAAGSDDAAWALGILTTEHIDSEALGKVATALSRDHSDSAAQALRAMVEKSPHASVRGLATFAMARGAKNLADSGKFLADMDPSDENYEAAMDFFRDQLGAERLADIQKPETRKRLMRRFEELTETVQAQYAEVAYRDTTLGEVAGRDLFEIRNLAIGKIAPDIEGEDIDGVAFKLSDYRGKVVMLDFWGHW